jgi:two-component system cell cycle response regulator CtrA
MRVLLIEDDSATAQSIELMLRSANLNVYTTDLGEEGIDLGKVYDHDIILLDLNLPDMSGFDVLRKLRISKVKTPILILSGLAAIEDKIKGLGFGADDWSLASTPSCVDPRDTPSRSLTRTICASISVPRWSRSTAHACI